MKLEVLFCVALIVLPGCVVGPHYKKPSFSLPKQYDENPSTNPTNLCFWWQQFNDPYLNYLLEQAIHNNYDLRKAIEKIEETRAIYEIERARLFPQVDAIGTIQKQKFSENLIQSDFIPNKSFSYFQAGFDALWELDFWGRLRHLKNAAYDLYEAQIEDSRDVYVLLLAEIARTYIDIRSLEKKIELTIQLINISQQLLTYDSDLFSSGLESEIPVLQENIDLDALTSQKLLLEKLLKQAINRLAVLVGEQPEQFRMPHNAKIPSSEQLLAAGLPSELLRNRADIRRAERQLAAATEQVGAAIAEWFPKFSLLGYATWESNKGSEWFSNKSLSWSIGPSLRWPIITFGRIRFHVEATKSVQKQALLMYENTVINALKDVENALIEYFKTQEQLDIIKDQYQQAQKEALLTSDLFNAGLADELRTLRSEKNVLEIALILTDIQQTLSTALVAVYKALGGGW
jgi:NodT family efflux transporter outer membrane factor (OMF) lipoprotein